jgi:hypothetical protein
MIKGAELMVDSETQKSSFDALTAQGNSIQEKFLSFFPDVPPAPFPKMNVSPPSITPAFDTFKEQKAASPKLEEHHAQTNAPSKPQA